MLPPLREGECFGEGALLDGAPHHATVTCSAADGCELLCLARDDFVKLMRRSSALHEEMRRLAASREREKRVRGET